VANSSSVLHNMFVWKKFLIFVIGCKWSMIKMLMENFELLFQIEKLMYSNYAH